MAYDEVLAERIRDLLAAEAEVTEKRMFGGLAFLLEGHMALAVSGQGGLMVRVEPDDTERLLATTKAEPMVMRGRDVKGWVRVAPEHVKTKRQLVPWVERGLARARSTD
ncbi:TfoX/Sxy family protein [Aquihabitans sp. G128]|uniref:TfoX/Sxy family protein n=1 Tax=Aquihabitans sp. G128 TaxID=2849779 RepID=UPI001C248DA1|nr:TfoX/Sxy family protein [Aquihabitans sp. G128]QXC59900.1 TfoX/Sxy family protein [Aquihabitans sp. G128]